MVERIKHGAVIFTIPQTFLEGEPAVSRLDVFVSELLQIEFHNRGHLDHFTFRDPDVAPPAAANTLAGIAGFLIEGKREISHR